MATLRSVPDPEPEVEDIMDEDEELIGEMEAAALEEDHLVLLKALRNRICETLDLEGLLPRDLASLSRRLQDVSREISQLGGEDGPDPVGDAADTEDEDWGA